MTNESFTDSTKNIISSILEHGIGEIKDIVGSKLLEYQVEEYRRSKFVKSLLYTLRPVELEKIYEPISIMDSIGQKIKIESVGDLFESSEYITLIGDAGSGKSTLIKYLTLKIIRESKQLPITFELRYLNLQNNVQNSNYSFSNIHNYLIENIIKANKIKNHVPAIERLLNSGKLIIFLDGFDELKKELRGVILKEIDSFIKKYPKNKYILTSRPSSNAESIPLFHTFNILPLSDNGVIKFIKKQLIKDELKTKIIKTITDKKNIQYFYLLNNPLLLSLFILTYQINSNLPERKSSFYRQVFEALFTRHDSVSKLGFDREKLCNLNKEKYGSILEQFSIISLFERNFAFEESYFQDKLGKIRENEKDYGLYEIDNLIEDLVVSIGIIQKDSIYYLFPHKSIQEYFAALFIKNMETPSLKEKAYQKIIENGLINEINFLGLCRELDYYNMSKYFTLPILQHFIQILELAPIFKPKTGMIKVDSSQREITIWKVFNHFFDTIEATVAVNESGYNIILNDFIQNSYHKSEKLNLFQFLLQPTNLTNWVGYNFEESMNSLEEYLRFTGKENVIDLSHILNAFEESHNLTGTYNIGSYDTWNYLHHKTELRNFTVNLIQEIFDKIEKISDQLHDFDERNDTILDLL